MRASKAHCSLGTRVHRAIRTLGALFMLAAVELASPAKTFAAQDVASVLERVVAYDFWGWNICGEGPDRASAYCCGITQTWTYLSNREDPQGYPPIIWFLYDIEWNENGVISHSQVEKPAEEKWTCPTSDYTFDESSRTCQPKAGMHVTKNRGAPQQPGVSAMPTFCPPQPGNPINVGIGTKFQIETDYESAGPAPLVFMRYYNSGTAGVQQTTIGAQWRTTFDRSISLTEGPTLTTASAYRPEGNIYHFNSSAGSWTSDPDVLDRLERLEDGQGNPTGWQYTTAEGLIETYDVAGKLLSMADRRGFTWSLAYGQGRLETVVGPFGRSLAFEYDASGLLSRMTAPGGQIYQYGHDSNGDLVSVTYPDLHSKTYLYSEPAHSQSGRLHDLTGVVDENGDRYATYGYASNGGAAILSEHAGGAGRTTVSYSATPLRRTVKYPLGHLESFDYVAIHGAMRVTAANGGRTPYCSAAAQASYDGNGFLAQSVDYNGVVTNYAYSARGTETSRTEAAGTPNARVVTTVWHPSFNLPTEIHEPGRSTLLAPAGWSETEAGERTGGRHRQWRDEEGRMRRRWDAEGREGGKERGPHWHDYGDPSSGRDHIDPDDL